MAGNKRASMREGPLAALFRKTAEDREHEGKPRKPDRSVHRIWSSFVGI